MELQIYTIVNNATIKLKTENAGLGQKVLLQSKFNVQQSFFRF